MSAPVQTWCHQKPATEYLLSKPNSVLNLKMGGGKTRITIDALRQVSTQGTKKTIILCPTAVLGVWRGEMQKHAPGEFDVVILDGSGGSKEKSKRVIDALARRQAGGLPLAIVINYELFFRPNIYDILMRNIWERIVADECHKLKSPKHDAKASKSAWILGKRAGGRIGMTGTLLPHSPMDVFAQYRFLQEEIFGKYITHFRNRYCVMSKHIPQAVEKWVNQEEMQQKINLIRYWVNDDFLVLPEKQDIMIEVPLAPAGMKVYQQMRKDAIAFVKRQREEGGEESRTAVACNSAVKFLRLLQLAQGYVGDENGEEIDTDTQKRKVLMELIEDAGEPVVVYGFFKHDLKIVEDICLILGLRYGELSGRKKDLTDTGEMPEGVDVFGVQVKSGSSGISLVRSRIGIFMNSGMISPGDYEQVLARQYRPGQTRNMRYYHLLTPNTVDITIARARADKKDVIDAILDSEEFF